MRQYILLFLIGFLFSIWSANAQYNYQNYNKIGVSAGYLMADIQTDDLPLSSGDGFMFGFETRGSFSRYIDFIFGLTYYDAAMDLETSGSNLPLQNSGNIEQTTMKLSSVQVQFMASVNIIRHHLSIELGPAVAIQGKFKPKTEADKTNFVAGYNALTVNDLREVSTVDFRGVASITTGFEPFRISLLYVYGFTNSLANLRQANTVTSDFSGNTSYLALRGIVYF